MREIDPRQVRTRAALVGAATELLDERDTADISVTDLANRAGVTRKSLYLNFLDRDAVLQAAGVQRYEQALTRYHLGGGGGFRGTATAIVEHLREHSDFYRRLLSGSCGIDTYRAIQGFLGRGISRAAEQHGISLDETEQLLLSGGSMAVLIRSVETDWVDGAAGEETATRLADLLAAYLSARSVEQHFGAPGRVAGMRELAKEL